MEFTIRYASDWSWEDPPMIRTFTTIQELADFSKEVKNRLVIDFDHNSITVYDDYIE